MLQLLNLDARAKKINYEELATMEKLIAQYKKDGIDLEKTEDPSIKSALETLDKVPAKWRISTSGILGVILDLVALAMVTTAFMKKEIVKKTSMVIIGLATLLLIITPSIESGKRSGVSPKTIAIIIFVRLLIVTASSMFSYKLYEKKRIKLT